MNKEYNPSYPELDQDNKTWAIVKSIGRNATVFALVSGAAFGAGRGANELYGYLTDLDLSQSPVVSKYIDGSIDR